MSRPPINPEKSTAGIAVDPITLQRVIPESRRPDGSVRKQIKVRPGFTPQEDVKRFRGTKQTQMDASALPKGHIIGWVAPSSATQPQKPMSKSAKKNAKRREKRTQQKDGSVPDEPVCDNWEDDDDDDDGTPDTSRDTVTSTDRAVTETPSAEHTSDKPNRTTRPGSKDAEKLASDLEKLNVK